MEQLKKIFYDNYAGLSLNALIKKAYKEKLGLSVQQIKDFYKEQEVIQVNKQPRTKLTDYIHITVPTIGYIAADLMDYATFFHSNKGFKYILTVIDVYSRYAWAFPLKTKKPKEVLPHLKEVKAQLEKQGDKFKTFTIDYGGEFLGPVKKWLEENEIKIYIAQERDNSTFKFRNAIVERFNRTLNERITKATFVLDKAEWVGVLPELMKGYNATEHHTIGQKPISVFTGKKKPNKVIQNRRIFDKVKIGDWVRILSDGNKLTTKRGLRGKSAYSSSVYKILGREGYRYTLVDKNDKKQSGTYLARQLVKVNEQVTKNDKELETLTKIAKVAKKFVKEQQKTGLDIDEDGKIKNIPINSTKRERKAPKKFDDYI